METLNGGRAFDRTTLSDAPTYPRFTQEMKATHKLLVPQMAPIHFKIIMDAIAQEGYDIEVLQNDGPGVVREGLQYVHNDACYPALVVIGQFIDALKTGRYDPDKTALILTQTGGGCRASNYVHLLRKALVKAGFPQIPVASINFSNLERNSGLRFTLPLLLKALAGCYYGDALMALSNQIRPYETERGEADRRVAAWQSRVSEAFTKGRGTGKRDMQRTFHDMAEDFASIPVKRRPTYKVGIVGEIFVKYSPLGNNNLEAFLGSEDCEVNVPGLTGFVQYCIANYPQTIRLYGGNTALRGVLERLLQFTISREEMLRDALVTNGLKAPCQFAKTMEIAERFIGMGTKMGEGWLLTGEMAELMESGYPNVICAQPFGCLPNHIVGRGMTAKIRAAYPSANIVSIDYDPGATRVNQENRIRLMLSSGEKTYP